MRLIIVVVAYHAKVNFVDRTVGGVNTDSHRVVNSLFEAAQVQPIALFDDSYPRTGYIDIAQSSHVAVFHSFCV